MNVGNLSTILLLFLLNVLFGPFIGSMKTELPKYKKNPLREEKKKGCSAILASPPALGPQTKKRMAQNFLSSSFPSSLWLHIPTRSVCALNAPVLYDLSHRSRMGKISAIQVPNLNPSLVHTYLATTLRGEVDRDSCIRVRRVEESLCHRLFT